MIHDGRLNDCFSAANASVGMRTWAPYWTGLMNEWGWPLVSILTGKNINASSTWLRASQTTTVHGETERKPWILTFSPTPSPPPPISNHHHLTQDQQTISWNQIQATNSLRPPPPPPLLPTFPQACEIKSMLISKCVLAVECLKNYHYVNNGSFFLYTDIFYRKCPVCQLWIIFLCWSTFADWKFSHLVVLYFENYHYVNNDFFFFFF